MNKIFVLLSVKSLAHNCAYPPTAGRDPDAVWDCCRGFSTVSTAWWLAASAVVLVLRVAQPRFSSEAVG